MKQLKKYIISGLLPVLLFFFGLLIFITMSSNQQDFFFILDGQNISDLEVNHDGLKNLNWSVAGHIIDTDINLSGYDLSTTGKIVGDISGSYGYNELWQKSGSQHIEPIDNKKLKATVDGDFFGRDILVLSSGEIKKRSLENPVSLVDAPFGQYALYTPTTNNYLYSADKRYEVTLSSNFSSVNKALLFNGVYESMGASLNHNLTGTILINLTAKNEYTTSSPLVLSYGWIYIHYYYERLSRSVRARVLSRNAGTNFTWRSWVSGTDISSSSSTRQIALMKIPLLNNYNTIAMEIEIDSIDLNYTYDSGTVSITQIEFIPNRAASVKTMPHVTKYLENSLFENLYIKNSLNTPLVAMRTDGDLDLGDVTTNNVIRLEPSSARMSIGNNSLSYPLMVSNTVSGISGYFAGNISSTGYITRTHVFDKNKNTKDYIKDADYYIEIDSEKNKKINHKKFYGYVTKNITITDFSKPLSIIKKEKECILPEIGGPEICKIVDKEEITYPYNITIISEGVMLDKEIELLRQALYEANLRIEKLENKVE